MRLGRCRRKVAPGFDAHLSLGDDGTEGKREHPGSDTSSPYGRLRLNYRLKDLWYDVYREMMNKSPLLYIAALIDRTRALGPGERLAIWVQGCPFSCPGCVAPEFLPSGGGEAMSVNALAARAASANGLEGVTVSGGEPFAQADGLAALLAALPRSLSIIVFTGYGAGELARLARRREVIGRALARIDVLIDGRYQHAENDSRGLRGSRNQTVHFLTARYRHLRDWFEAAPRTVERIEDGQGAMLVGVPPLALWREWMGESGR
jgi:anaerobic ribonucleoside-triphosphate reductase activating protein